MTWQCISPGVTVKCCMSNVVNETDDDMLWNVKRMEYWGGGTLTVKVEAVTLIGECTKNLTGFVYKVYENNSKIFF